MKMESPAGLPQIVSFVPLEKRFVFTVSANQFVVRRFVEYSGAKGTPLVSVVVDVKTSSAPNVRPTISTTGGRAASMI